MATGAAARTHVCIAGGGLAGLAAACELASRGYGVTVVEARPFLGGKTYSFPAESAVLDNGQHVFLRCCTAYIGFLRRLGVLGRTRLQRRLDVPVAEPGGRTGRLAALPLPAPLHLSRALLAYPHLARADRLLVARAALAALRVSDRRLAEYDGETFEQWLRRHGQSASAIENFWDLLVVATCNAPASVVSAATGLFVLRRGFLTDPRGAAIGLPLVGLSELHVDPAVRYVQARGGDVRVRSAVQQVCVDGDSATALMLADGRRLTADAFVLAVPWLQMGALLPEQWRTRPPFAAAARLRAAPIVNLHVRFGARVLRSPLLACVGTPIQWVFDRSGIQGASTDQGQWVTVSLSAAEKYLRMTKREIEEALLPELRRVLQAPDAPVWRCVVVKEPEATFAPEPGTLALRPGPVTPIRNLFLAGAWTDTGWPATMEGAVRSGLAAASALAERVPVVRQAAAASEGDDRWPSQCVRASRSAPTC